MAPTPKREKVCYPHNSPSCEQCFSGSVEEPTFVKPKPIEPREEWEIKFEEVVARNYRGQDPYWPDWEGVKSFIRTHKKLWERQAREEVVTLLKEMKKTCGGDSMMNDEYEQCHGFNQALADAIQAIKK